jgi:hypothetical protein
LALWLCAACTSPADAPRQVPREPQLPAGEAGRVLQRAIDAAGGWERWRSLRDVSYISMLTIVDPQRQVTSDSIGWFMAPLHDGARARMDSLGLPTEVRFGIDAHDTWIVSNGTAVTAPGQLALTRFDMVSSLFWFSLPFRLAETPSTVSYLGEQAGEGGARWLRVKAEFDEGDPAVPGNWFILYLDADTGLIDHILGRLTAPFLRHELWVGQWLHYRDCDGIKKERQRKFFPADADGAIVGEMVAEQFVERVRFNTGYAPEHFSRPPAADEKQPADEGDRPGQLSSGRTAAVLGGSAREARPQGPPLHGTVRQGGLEGPPVHGPAREGWLEGPQRLVRAVHR